MHRMVNGDVLSRLSSSWRSPRLARRFSTSAWRRRAGNASNASMAFVASSSYPPCRTKASAGIAIGVGEGTKLSRAHWAVIHTRPSSINTDATISVVRIMNGSVPRDIQTGRPVCPDAVGWAERSEAQQPPACRASLRSAQPTVLQLSPSSGIQRMIRQLTSDRFVTLRDTLPMSIPLT